MLLTELSGLQRIMECGDMSIEMLGTGLVLGLIIGIVAYHFLKCVGTD